MPANSSLTNEDIESLLNHADQALKSAMEKNSERFGAIAEGDIDFKKLSQDALGRMDPMKVWEDDDYAVAKSAVTKKFGLDVPLEKLAEMQGQLKAAQKKLDGLERLAGGDVLATAEAIDANQKQIEAMQKEIAGLEEGIEDTQMQVRAGRALVNAQSMNASGDKKARVAAANVDLAAEKGAKVEAPAADKENQNSVRFAFQGASPKAARGGLQMGSAPAAKAGEGQENSVRGAIKWQAAKPDTSKSPGFSAK